MNSISKDSKQRRLAMGYYEIFQETTWQLEILLKNVNDNSDEPTLFAYYSPEERFGDKMTPVTEDISNLTESDLSNKKLRNDMIAMYRIFLASCNTLQDCEDYKVFILALANVHCKLNDDYNILNCDAEKHYRFLHRHIFDINEKLETFKNQDYYLKNIWFSEGTSLNKRILFEIGYMTRWMKSQIEIQKIVLRTLYSKAYINKKLMEKSSAQEDRIHPQITAFYHYAIQCSQESIHNWDLKRDSDEADLIRKIHEMKLRRYELKEEMTALQRLYDKRQKEMDDYLNDKELKRQEREEERLREIENEETNLIEIEMQKLKKAQLLRKKYLAKEKKKRKRG